MNFSSRLLENAVAEFSRLPGVGQKTALRLVLHLLNQPAQDVERFSDSLTRLKNEIRYCEECKNRIIKYVSRDLGVQKVEVDWRKGITKVQYIPHRINPETIRVNIANLGYDADDEERLEEAFKKLPKACQIDRKKP